MDLKCAWNYDLLYISSLSIYLFIQHLIIFNVSFSIFCLWVNRVRTPPHHSWHSPPRPWNPRPSLQSCVNSSLPGAASWIVSSAASSLLSSLSFLQAQDWRLQLRIPVLLRCFKFSDHRFNTFKTCREHFSETQESFPEREPTASPAVMWAGLRCLTQRLEAILGPQTNQSAEAIFFPPFPTVPQRREAPRLSLSWRGTGSLLGTPLSWKMCCTDL